MTRVLIIGGYGAFGALLSERLARETGLELVIAGRDANRARAFAEALRPRAAARLTSAFVDATRVRVADLIALAPRIVINASGPFQKQDYTAAEACISAGCHYIDLADARTFVTGITRLDDAARHAGVCVISGASSVPGLSSAVYLDLRPRFSKVSSLEIYLSPGNHFTPGEATTAAVLGGVGKPIPVRVDGRDTIVHGWHGLTRRTIPGIGPRLFGHVGVPDLDLFPEHDPNLDTVIFQAGVEVSVFHLGLWTLGGLVRAGVLRDASRFTRGLLRAKRALGFLGSDRGGMLMIVSGLSRDGSPLRLSWSLAATEGHGPYIPTVASTILAKRLARDLGPQPGAKPCFGLFTLQDFLAEVSDLRITSATSVEN